MADTRKSSPKQKQATTGKQGRRGPAPAAGNRNRPGVRDARGKLVKGAAARRLEAKRRRQRALTWTAVVVVAVAVIVGVIVWQGRDSDRVSPQALAAARQQAGSTGVTEYPEAGRDHIEPNQQPDNWNSNPPTSGDHLANWVQPGVYNSEQDMRGMVHSLEHGYVLILYRDIPKDDLDQLETFVEDRDGSKLILAPYSGLEQNGVALAAWRNLEVLQRVNMDVVQAFVNDYMVPVATKSVAPEPNAA
jgi:hypothetical protein